MPKTREKNYYYFKIIFIILGLLIQNGVANQQDEKIDETFDFIIVGGGTAGCVIANRLSEIPEWKILLLEAGNESKNFLTKVPAFTSTTIFTEPLWNYTTEIDNTILKGFENNQINYQTGKLLGGSSSINFMMYTRGNRDDYSRWEQLGNPGWSYMDVLPYFLKSEASNMEFFEKNYHNSSGLMSIEHAYVSETSKDFLHTIKNLGYNIVDYNGENQLGFSPIQATLQKGRRQTSNDAFLKPILRKRKNLKILTSSQVIKLIYDQTNTKIHGVKFIKNGQRTRVLAKKEVILSAGVINTPKLLLLSGIGPKHDLEQLQIPSIIDLQSVGKNLQDHLTYIGLNFLTNTSKNELELTLSLIRQLPVWLLTNKGIFTSLGGFETIGFIKSNKSIITQNYPDFELIFTNTIINPMFKKFTNLKNEIYEKFYKPVENEIEWTIYPVLLHPKSKGHIKLKSKNVNEPPLIYPNYLSNLDDIEMMSEAIDFVLKLINRNEFKKLGLTLNPNLVPNCERLRNKQQYWECAIRTLTTTTADQFGTCRMGPKDNPESVVDHRFKVHGLDNLRIGDASVIPTTISGHLYATTIMIGERLADFIKEDYIKV